MHLFQVHQGYEHLGHDRSWCCCYHWNLHARKVNPPQAQTTRLHLLHRRRREEGTCEGCEEEGQEGREEEEESKETQEAKEATQEGEETRTKEGCQEGGKGRQDRT